MLQDKCTCVALKGSGNLFDGNIGARSFHRCAGREHLPFPSTFEITVIVFVEEHAIEKRIVGVIVLRSHFYIERSSSVMCHVTLLSTWSIVLRESKASEEQRKARHSENAWQFRRSLRQSQGRLSDLLRMARRLIYLNATGWKCRNRRASPIVDCSEAPFVKPGRGANEAVCGTCESLLTTWPAWPVSALWPSVAVVPPRSAHGLPCSGLAYLSCIRRRSRDREHLMPSLPSPSLSGDGSTHCVGK